MKALAIIRLRCVGGRQWIAIRPSTLTLVQADLKATRATSPEGGMRQMKCYAVTEEELETLGLLQYNATACFSRAAASIDFAVSITQSPFRNS